MNQKEYETELQRPEKEKIRENEFEICSRVMLAGAAGFILGRFSGTNFGKYLFSTCIGVLSGYLGCEYAENNENRISAQGAKIVERRFGNDWTGYYKFPVLEVDGKVYLFDKDTDGKINGLVEIDEIKIDIKNKEAYAEGLEYLMTAEHRTKINLNDLDRGLCRKLMK